MDQNLQCGQLWRLIKGEPNKALNPMQFEKNEYYLVLSLHKYDVELMTTTGVRHWIYQSNLLRYLYCVS